MDISELYDDYLTTIKAFHTHITDIISKGYNNEMDTLSILTRHIDNYINEITNSNQSLSIDQEAQNQQVYHLNESSELSDSDDSNNYCKLNKPKVIKTKVIRYTDEENNTESSSSSDSENEIKKNKEINKVNKFIENSDDISNIYLYKKYNNYIYDMNNYINNSLEY